MKAFILLLIITLLDQFFFGSSLIDYIVVGLTLILLFRVLYSLTKVINIFEIVALIAALTYLLMPLVTYNIYNEYHARAKLFDTFMKVDKIEYYSLALPATLLFIIGLNFNKEGRRYSDFILIQRCKEYLKNRKHIGYFLLGIGLFTTILSPSVPESLHAVVYYVTQLTFIGALYLFHSNVKGKGLLVLMIACLLVFQSIITGMYLELIYWSVLGGTFLLLGRHFSMVKKVIYLICFTFIVFIIQSIKHEYREETWGTEISQGDSFLFLDLVWSRLKNPASVFDENKLYGVVVRGNQGYLVARTMDYVPSREEFAKGETILTSFAASIVPRFLWPDKPKLGGGENTCRFLGDCYKRKYSYNIGQLGESYANFGVVGGAFVMFLYGWFMRFAYNQICNMSVKRPTLILWIPLFFYMSISLETDFLTFFNLFTKAIFFAVLIYGGFKMLKIRI